MKIGLAGFMRAGTEAARDARGMRAALEGLGHEVVEFASASPGGQADPALDAFLADPLHLAILWEPDEPAVRRRIVRGDAVHAPARHPCNGLRLFPLQSQFDASTAAGIQGARAGLLPVFDDAGRIVAVAADTDRLRDWQRRDSTWLAVAPLAEAASRWLFEAFAMYLARCDASTRLLVVAPHDPARDTSADVVALREDAERIGASAHVEILADANDATLKAAYLSADTLIAAADTTQARGAAIQAMVLGVPVTGARTIDLASITGDAALLWGDATPALFAATVERLRGDASLRDVLRERGFARFAGTFSRVALERRLAALLLEAGA
jgi:glycosyltransferase involved in cell wall biosynthesis